MVLLRSALVLALAVWLSTSFRAGAQIDPLPRSLLQLGVDQSLTGGGPQAIYAYYYYNNPSFLSTNVALRLAIAPVYLDAELGFREVLPHTDVGIGLNGGGFGENYYEIRQGRYLKEESFDGHGGGISLNLYRLIDPDYFIPLNFVFQGGTHYSTYGSTSRTADLFQIPANRESAFTKVGLRFAGKEPMLDTDLGMELSIWFERRWRLSHDDYGFAGDRRVEPASNLYWLYGGLSYAWTNTGNQVALGLNAGGSDNADRFSAWRLGGVLPLAAEFPLTLPGYYYQEISARRFVHLSVRYIVPLSKDHRWQLRLDAASAWVDYLPGFEQPGHWHSGVGPSLSFTSRSQVWRMILRYGYGFDALRDGSSGAQSVGALFQYNFEQRKVRDR